MKEIPLLQGIYILCIIPGLIAFIFQFISFSHDTDVNIDSDFDSDLNILEQFEFKLGWAVICNFLLCFGIVGYLLYSFLFILSLPIAACAGFGFAYGFARLLFLIHLFCKESENITPRPKKGTRCISTTGLNEVETGSVNIKINNKEYEYLAKSIDGNIKYNT